MSTIDLQSCGIAIDYCEPMPFEHFVQAFHAEMVGSSFVPLGGVHDGGADGFEDAIFEGETRPTSFLQASKVSNINGRFRRTVRRLVEFGRSVTQATFYFSQPISNSDRLEEDLSAELGIAVRIRSKQYIVSHVNHFQPPSLRLIHIWRKRLPF